MLATLTARAAAIPTRNGLTPRPFSGARGDRCAPASLVRQRHHLDGLRRTGTMIASSTAVGFNVASQTPAATHPNSQTKPDPHIQQERHISAPMGGPSDRTD